MIDSAKIETYRIKQIPYFDRYGKIVMAEGLVDKKGNTAAIIEKNVSILEKGRLETKLVRHSDKSLKTVFFDLFDKEGRLVETDLERYLSGNRILRVIKKLPDKFQLFEGKIATVSEIVTRLIKDGEILKEKIRTIIKVNGSLKKFIVKIR